MTPLELVSVVFFIIIGFIAIVVLGAAIVTTVRINTNAKKSACNDTDDSATGS